MRGFSDRQLRLARTMRLHGFTYREIGQTFGVSDTCARYAIRGREHYFPKRTLTVEGDDPWFEAASLGLEWDEARAYVERVAA